VMGETLISRGLAPKSRGSKPCRHVQARLGFGGFWTARRTLAGFEAMAMIKKGQIRRIDGNDIKAQSAFIAGLFQIAA
jgi:transposase, IS6 family